MKRILLSLLAILMALSMILVGCNEEPPTPDNPNPPDNGNNGEQNPPAQTTTFTKTENYMPAEVFTQMKAYFEGTEKGFEACSDRTSAPYVGTDLYAITNCTVKSITIPVFSTGKADKNGNFTFSIYVVPNDWSSLRTAITDPDEPIVIEINAEEYGLEESKLIRKFIKVDLTDYDITLSAGETLGFSHADDTLIPARVLTKGYVTNGTTKGKYAPAKYMIDEWDVVGYYYCDTTDQSFAYIGNSLFFDFELERTWESEAVYNAQLAAKQAADADYAAKLAAVKAAYAGKSLSLIGDSISTFNSVTNDSALGLGDNPAYSQYTLGGTIYDYTKTYWGKLCADTDMELCVINSWGGGKVYGWPNKYEGKDGMLLRSYNLAKGGKAPDLILLNFGINDMGGGYSSAQEPTSSAFTGDLPTGNLYQRLTAANKTKTDKEIVAEWFAEVETYAAQGGFDPADPRTITFNNNNKSNIYTCWEAAYALSLQNIKRLYPDAEVFCITLPDRNHTSSTQPRLTRANLLISALAEYFELGLVDQSESGITRENCMMYSSDGTGLHPNGKGHAALTKVIVEALYENLQK